MVDNFVHNIHYIDTVKQLEGVQRLAQHWDTIFLDIETTGLDHRTDSVRSVTVSGVEGDIYVIDWVKHRLGQRFCGSINKGQKVVAHNSKFEQRFLGELIECAEWHDTLLLSKIVNPLIVDHSLEAAAYRWVTRDAFKAKDAMTVADLVSLPVDCEQFQRYAAADVFLLRELYGKLLDQIRVLNLGSVARLEHDLLPIIMRVEDRGIYVDVEESKRRAHLHRARAEQSLTWLLNDGLDTMSAENVAKYLEEKTGANWLRRDDGRPDTCDDNLERLGHEAAGKVLEVRRRRKLASTYYDAFVNLSDSSNILRASFNQLGARTGRMSSARPNLQNIPSASKIDESLRIGSGPREVLKSRDGGRLVSVDYSQIEPRIAARLSQDSALIEACESGDIYANIHDHRPTAKMLILAVTYGAGSATLAKQSGMDIAELDHALEQFRNKFWKLERYRNRLIEQVEAQAAEAGECFVLSEIGRRTWFEPRHRHTRALNGVIQSTAGDILKKAIIDADRAGLSQWFVSIVHDEIIADVPAELVEEFRTEIKNVMEHANTSPPLIVESVTGMTYAELK